MNFSIKDWPEQERPRERLLQQGAASLSDAELLAIFLRSGSKQHSAVELARLLIKHFQSLSQLLNASAEDMQQFHGMGMSKYVQLMAVKELGRRYVAEQFQHMPLTMDNSAALIDFLRFELLDETREVFAVLCLDAELNKISFKKLFFGTLSYCDISINALLRHVINERAVHIVITHNHPKGQAHPSPADISLTQRIVEACALVEIHCIDHCIIAQNGYFSFAEHQLIASLNPDQNQG